MAARSMVGVFLSLAGDRSVMALTAAVGVVLEAVGVEGEHQEAYHEDKGDRTALLDVVLR